MTGILYEDRLRSEIAHGKKLAGVAEKIWNWQGAIGQARFRRRVKFLALALKRGGRALELGCGTGLFSEGLLARGAELFSIDISGDLLEMARQKLPRGRFEERDACATGFPDGYFDAVVGSSVLHHLDQRTALAEIFRVLKPGGAARFTEPNLMNPHIFIQKTVPWIKEKMGDSPHETAFVRWGLEEDFRRTGFSRVTIRPFDFLYPFLPEKSLPLLEKAQAIFEKIPLFRELAGSLEIEAVK